MILRKPYAFLIKHFKFIHLILTVLMFFFFQRIRELVEFFNDYIDLKTFENITGVVKDNFNSSLLILPIIIIALIVVIMWLLITKEKPVKYYAISVGAYIVEIITVIIAYTMMITIQQGEPDPNIITIYRDFLDLISYVPIPLMIISLARGVGFNVKQFNFKKDMSELNISDEDNEEFELEVNVDTEDIKSKFNRKKRFIKYVYLENKTIIWSVGIISVLVIGIVTFFILNSGEKIFLEGDSFKAYGVEVSVDKSYKINTSPTGKTIKKDKFFILVSINLKNTLNEETKLPYNKIYIKLNDENKYSPTDDYLNHFNEFGFRFLSYNTLNANESRKLILVYEIDNKYLDSSYRLEYITKENETEDYEYAKVELKPIEYKKETLITTKKVGEELKLDESLLDGTSIIINEVEFNNRYTYKYKQTIGGVEKEFTKTIIPTNESTYKKTILKIKVDMIKNTKLNPKVYSSIFEKFGVIEYEVNGKMLTQKVDIIDLTPNNSEYTYLEVINAVGNSNKVSLIFKVRDKEYKYELINKEEN